MQDDTLLTQYARDGSEAAFSQIISRHMTLVYRTCLRETSSHSQAEDAAQIVFLLLARKAKSLHARPSLSGWLYQTSRFVAQDVRKQEARRKLREEAVMQEIVREQTTPAPEWAGVEPLLNSALSSLKPAEREAVLLRFFEGYNLAETGTLLGVTEAAARMRCTRALDKLRRYLTAHGSAVTGLILTGLLTSEAAHPVPAHAAVTITQGTLQAIASGPTANVLLLSKGVSHTMKLIKVKAAAIASTTLLIGASIPPLAHAFIPHQPSGQVFASSALSAEASAQAIGTQTASTSPSTVTQTIVLQHILLADLLKAKHWDQAAHLPIGVTKIEAVPAQNALAVTATPAGLANVQNIVAFLDQVLRQVQIQAAYADVTEADLAAFGVKFSLVPLGKPQAGSAPVLVRYASGSPAAGLLQTLTKQNAITQAPNITTTNNVTATINIATTLPSGQIQSTETVVTPRINSDNSVTLALRLTLTDGTVKREISTLRTVVNGDTMVIVRPPDASLPNGKNMLLFVTSTVK